MENHNKHQVKLVRIYLTRTVNGIFLTFSDAHNVHHPYT